MPSRPSVSPRTPSAGSISCRPVSASGSRSRASSRRARRVVIADEPTSRLDAATTLEIGAPPGRARARHGHDGRLRDARPAPHRPRRPRGAAARDRPGSIGAMTSATIQVSGVRCERCIGRLAGALRGHDGHRVRERESHGRGRARSGTTRGRPATRSSPRSRARASAKCRPSGNRRGAAPRSGSRKQQRYGTPVSEAGPETEARRIATEARDRARFEEDALALADQVYRVARRLVGSREEAEDLVQETYARAFRSWRSFTPGTNLRAWLLRILTNLNVDRGRKIQRSPQTQPLEETDYYLANKVASAAGEEALETGRRRRAPVAGFDRQRALGDPAAVPRRRRAGRHRRLFVR